MQHNCHRMFLIHSPDADAEDEPKKLNNLIKKLNN